MTDRVPLVQVIQLLMRPFLGVGVQTPFDRGDLGTCMMNVITLEFINGLNEAGRS